MERRRTPRGSGRLILALTGAGLAALAAAAPPPAPAPVDFARDIRPVLAANCFACHGADDRARQAGLRLDLRDAALAARAIVPGKPERSALLRRVRATGALKMPPAGSGHTVTPAQTVLLERWIAAGAPYAPHWAFVAPQRPALPAVKGAARVRNPVDRFVLATLERAGLTLSPEADRPTLIRRVSLDLTGLPPTIAETDAFVADTKPGAYERVVDRLLASPRYGERMARPWLDIARYADSAGYGSDPLRPNLWPWRDWVIDAFNQNKRYDRFTIEQLAGDLLPGATQDQKIATAFHRNTMTNTEGGTSDEEFRMAAVKDRAIVTAQAWMGLTLQCAQCHTHKYDPITQTDFYRFAACFNQTEDNDQPDERPTLNVLPPADRERAAALDAQIARLEKQVAGEPRSPGALARYVRVTLPAPSDFLMLAEVEVFSGGKNVALGKTALQSSTGFDAPAGRAVDGRTDGNFAAGSVTHTNDEPNPWWEVDLGAAVPIDSVKLWPRTDAHVGRTKNLRIALLGPDRTPVADLPVPGAFTAPRDTPVTQSPTAAALAARRAERAAIRSVPLPVMREVAPDKRRTTHVLTLGNYLQPTVAVTPAVPSAFGSLPPGASADRLAVARWLVAKENPLTARVAVNRFWALLFGRGIVETEEDFGTQGALPSHPELLDWLAVEFRESGWDVKRLLRTLVTSATYRQSSRATPALLEKDPRAALLSRYPRRRLDAETVRDQALALSGLLSEKIGGPSVFPPQPDGLWQAAFNGDRTYPTSMGDDRHRRGLYTFWRRTVPHPSMAAFDAPSREFCTLRRQPTNTPLQALVTLNDPIYLEMARGLARRIVREGGSGPVARARYGLRLALGRTPTDSQVATLVRLWESARVRYGADRAAAATLAAPTDPNDDLPTLAAWTVVGNVLLNLDGVLTVG